MLIFGGISKARSPFWLAALLAGAASWVPPGAAQAQATQFQVIYTFQGSPDGSGASAGVVMDPQGRLYGTTEGGGALGVGTVYRLTAPSSGAGPWTEEILHSFDKTDGGFPVAPVVLGTDGSVYGTTGEFGSAQIGNVFSLANAPNWPLTVLHNFSLAEGGTPRSGLQFGSGGLLYGTTGFESLNSYAQTGTLFSISPLGDQVEYKVLHEFGMPGDGVGPTGLTSLPPQYFTGFVGTAGSQGANLAGNIFTLQTNAQGGGLEKTVYNFKQAPDVTIPTAPPIVGQGALQGSLFGCGAEGGTHNQGGIYRVVVGAGGSLTESVIYNFGDQPNDPNPRGPCSVVQGTSTGTLYGTSGFGGVYNGGTFFQLVPPSSPHGAWKETVDVSFNPTGPGGEEPEGTPLVVGPLVYGVTTSTVCVLKP
jgi:uncharacterized repeat protein (TIGR03803 family)